MRKKEKKIEKRKIREKRELICLYYVWYTTHYTHLLLIECYASYIEWNNGMQVILNEIIVCKVCDALPANC